MWQSGWLVVTHYEVVYIEYAENPLTVFVVFVKILATFYKCNELRLAGLFFLEVVSNVVSI